MGKPPTAKPSLFGHHQTGVEVHFDQNFLAASPCFQTERCIGRGGFFHRAGSVAFHSQLGGGEDHGFELGNRAAGEMPGETQCENP